MTTPTPKAVKTRLMISTALVALAALAPANIAYAETGGGGGNNSSSWVPGQGGGSNTTGQGEAGEDSPGGGFSGSGGGGAGETGGNGGFTADLAGPALGGQTAGAAGQDGASSSSLYGGNGGGGGAHGGVGLALPSAISVGGAGGNGGNGSPNSTGSGGGGGGAGGYGHVVTGSGSLGTLNANVTGGAGGQGGDSFGPSSPLAGQGGDGGKGLVFSNSSGATFTIADGATVSGGQGGAGGAATRLSQLGTPRDAAPSKGGAGLEGANLNVTLAGTVAGGAGSDGVLANAFNFTGGSNTLTIEDTATITGGIHADGTGTSFNLDDPEFTLDNVISGSARLQKTGAGRLTLSGDNTFTNYFDIVEGVLNVQSDTALGAPYGGYNRVLAGGALEIEGDITLDEAFGLQGAGISDGGGIRNISGTNEITGTVNLIGPGRINSDSGLLTLSNTVNSTLIDGTDLTLGGAGNGVISGNIRNRIRHLRKDGAGKWTLTGDSYHTGVTTIMSGVLNIQSNTALGSTSANTTVLSGAALELEDNITTGETVVLFGDGVSSDGAIRNASGANTISGDLVLNADSRVNSEAGTLTLAGDINGETGGGSPLNADLALGGAGNGIVSGQFGNQIVDLTKDGTGTWTLSGFNLHIGETVVNAGVLRITSSRSLGSTFEDTFVNSGAALELDADSSINVTDQVVINGSGIANGGAIRNVSGNNFISPSVLLEANSRINSDAGNLTLLGGVTGATPAQDLTLGGAGNGAISGDITALVDVIEKDGSGTWTLSGDNSHGEDTVIRSGALRAASNTALGGTTAGTDVFSGGALELIGGISISDEALTLRGTGVSNGGALRNISGDNTYGGDISALSDTRINSDSGHLTLTGTIDAAARLTLGGAGDGTVSGAFSNAPDLWKEGSGAWTLSGADKTLGRFRLVEGEVIVQDIAVTQTGTEMLIGTGANLGTLTLTGPDADWTKVDTGMSVGAGGQGRLEILNGASMAATYASVGNGGTSGSVLVSGAGSSWTFDEGLTHGLNSRADMTIEDGSLVSAQTILVALNEPVEATTLVTGSGSQLSSAGSFALGYSGQGSLTLSDGGTVSVAGGTGDMAIALYAEAVGRLNIGAAAGDAAATAGNVSARTIQFGPGDGEIVFNHTGTDYDFAPSISGNGDLSFLSGKTTLTGNNTYTGNTTISGSSPVSGAVLNVQSDSALGAASGSVDIVNSGVLELEGGVTVDKQALNIHGIRTGAGPIRNVSGDNTFTGVVNLGGTTNIGAEAGSLTLSGGVSGNGTSQDLTIIGSGDTNIAGISDIGVLETRGSGTLTLTGSNSVVSGVGISAGEIILRDGTMTRTTGRDLIGTSGGSGTLTVRGSNAIYNASSMSIGANSSASSNSAGFLQVLDGGTLTANSVSTGATGNTTGSILVSGANASVDANVLTVGAFGDGSLDILAGGSLDTGALFLGSASGSSGRALVSGPGSRLSVDGTFRVGGSSTGDLTVRDGGSVVANGGTGTITVGQNAVGKLNIGAGFGETAAGPGEIEAAAIDLALPTSEIILNHTGVFELDADIGGAGRINQYSGSTMLTGDLTYQGGTNIYGGTFQVGDGGAGVSFPGAIVADGDLIFDFSNQIDLTSTVVGAGTLTKRGSGTLTISTATGIRGGTTVSAGRLVVDDEFGGGDILVQSGGTLTGSGSIERAVTVADGGTLAGAAGRTLSMGTLNLSQNSIVQAALGAPTTTALFDLTGDLTLDGTLNVVDAGGYGAGVYRIMTYGGALTDNGLETGTSPAGFGQLDIQTAIANEINLVVNPADTGTPPGPGPAPAIQFWDGANTTANGAIDGGSGTWALGATNWTRTNGGVNDAWGGNFAVFQGAPATITVDRINGDVKTGGLQFADDGMRVEGERLGLIGADGQTTIRVGDGTQAGAGMTATMASALSGDSQLVKTDLGTLILTGANTYTGGTLVSDGTLVGSTTSIAGDVTNNARLVFDQATTGTFANTISGNGRVTKQGAGTLTLTGANTYAGGTEIAAGTLSVFSDANLGASSGALTFSGGTLATTGDITTERAVAFNADATFETASSTSLEMTGVLSGAGGLTKQGDGTLTLTGMNSYSGGTVINAGTLSVSSDANLGDGGAGVEFSGGTLRAAESFNINRSALVSGEGVIDTSAGTRLGLLGDLTGTGTLTKTGSGTLVLYGDSAFEGMTDVRQGHLIVGDSAGSGARLAGGVTIESGAYLSGSGSVGTTVVSGTVQPGNSIGTLSIAGNARFTSGSVYEVEVDPSGTASDLIDVAGSVTIESGAAVQHVGYDGVYAPVSTYTIIRSGGDVTGTFDTVGSDFAFLDASLGYAANEVTLTLTRNLIELADVAATRNQRAAAAGVDGLGYGDDLYGAILTLDAPAARYAYDQVSGELHASLKSALIADARYPREAALDRLRTGIGTGASDEATPSRRLSIWGDAYNGWGRMNGDGNTSTMSHETEGLLVGADANLSSGWRAGVLAGVSYSDQDVDARFSAANGEGAHLGVYGGGQWGRVSVNAGAIYAWHDIDTRRAVLFANVDERVRGQMDAQTRQAFGEVAYDTILGGVDVQPFAGLSYIELETDGLTESGDMAALHVAGDTTDATFSTLGTRARFPVALGRVSGSLTGKVAWEHGFGDLMPNAANTLSGSGTYRVQGVHLARDSAVIGTGLELALSEASWLAIGYEGSFNEENTQQAITARVGVRF